MSKKKQVELVACSYTPLAEADTHEAQLLGTALAHMRCFNGDAGEEWTGLLLIAEQALHDLRAEYAGREPMEQGGFPRVMDLAGCLLAIGRCMSVPVAQHDGTQNASMQ